MEGKLVVLEPLDARHEAGLWAAAQHPEIWTWTFPRRKSRPHFETWFQTALASSDEGQECAFATLDRASGRPIGSTGYHALREPHPGLEVGGTWLEPSAWGTGVNVEAKLLMLEHAFERRNKRSRGALAALPARFEGVFRR
ncbi:MAG TPA: GNAT family N-acetyltransferase, partial [Solirubrobacteraceae bacterium]|nr:GNAT family N-acetyltransferase [Solirubrobacteraceae bacterium]